MWMISIRDNYSTKTEMKRDNKNRFMYFSACIGRCSRVYVYVYVYWYVYVCLCAVYLNDTFRKRSSLDCFE